MKEFNYDAKDKPIGRAASDVARILMGKNDLEFAKNRVSDVMVYVVNADKLMIDPQKQIQKKYYRHSGYLGKLKEKSLKDAYLTSPTSLFTKVVGGMLPNNRLKTARLKRLKYRSAPSSRSRDR